MAGGKPEAPLVAAILIAAAFLAAIPSASAAASTGKTKKPKLGPPPRSPPAFDAGGGRSSSVVFPLRGDVYPHGVLYVSMSIGDPPKPYFLDVDTGSDLTWVQCDAPCVHCSKVPHPLYRPSKNKLVPCNDARCTALHSGHDDECESAEQCDYEIQYADHASSLGVLVTDAFSLRLANGSVARPHLAFGCGYDQRGMDQISQTDGMLGLGGGKSSTLSQLSNLGLTKDVVGHCISRRGSGYLFFGDDLVPSSGITWAPMSRRTERSGNFYSAGPASVYLGKQSLGLRPQEMVFDSGTSYAYLSLQVYQILLNAVKKDLSGTSLKEAPEDHTLPVCWKGPKPFRSILEVKGYFKPLVLNFVNGNNALMLIPPENYLIITNQGNACLGILNGTEAGLHVNVIGDIAMQDLMVVYNNEKQQIGWIKANCEQLPNADGNNGRCFQPLFTSFGMIPEQLLISIE